MKSSKSLQFLIATFLITISVVFSVTLAHPSTAYDRNAEQYSELLDLGLIDRIRNPEEIGLDYLRQDPVQLAQSNELMAAVRRGINQAAYLPENTPLKFRLGTNSPIAIRPEERGTPAVRPSSRAIGFVNQNGNPRPITRDNLIASGDGMFRVEERNNGLIAFHSVTPEILIADARGSFLQAQRLPRIDLIIEEPNGEVYLLLEININAFCRDALNAVLNNEVEINDYPVSRLSL